MRTLFGHERGRKGGNATVLSSQTRVMEPELRRNFDFIFDQLLLLAGQYEVAVTLFSEQKRRELLAKSGRGATWLIGHALYHSVLIGIGRLLDEPELTGSNQTVVKNVTIKQIVHYFNDTITIPREKIKLTNLEKLRSPFDILRKKIIAHNSLEFVDGTQIFLSASNEQIKVLLVEFFRILDHIHFNRLGENLMFLGGIQRDAKMFLKLLNWGQERLDTLIEEMEGDQPDSVQALEGPDWISSSHSSDVKWKHDLSS